MDGRGRWWLVAVLAVLAVLATMSGCVGQEPPDDGVATVFVGDSITRGVSPETLAPDDSYSWVEYVGSEPGTPWRPVEVVADFGQTLVDMAGRFEADVLSLDPPAVVIMGGTNDALRQLPVEPSTEALRSMVTAAQEAGAEVWIVAPPPLDPAYGRDLEPYLAAQAALAEELGVEYVDVRAELAAADGSWQEGLSFDGVHPSQAGAHRLATLVVEAATGG